MQLVLGPLERSHLPQLQRWRNSPAMLAHTRGQRPLSLADQEQWFEWQRKDPGTQMFAVMVDGELRGCAGLCYIDWLNRHAELSVYVMDLGDRQDPILEVSATKTLIAHAFQVANLHRVWAETYVPERDTLFRSVGMHLDGSRRHTVRRGGQWLNSNFYSLLEDEWRSAHSE